VVVCVRHEQQRTLVQLRRIDGLQRAGGETGQRRPDLRLGHQYGGQRRRRLPTGLLRGADDRLDGRAAEQLAREPLQPLLPDPAGGRQLVGVAGDARRRQLVDVGEDQLREADQRLGVRPGADRGRRHLPPRDAGADPERGQQCLGGPSAPRLPPAQLVGALDRGRGGRGLGRQSVAGQGEEAAERELDGVADVLAHRAAERTLVARHLCDDGRDGLVGDRRQPHAHRGDRLGRQVQALAGGADRAKFDHSCLLRTIVT
jgi:hypothetical protein